MEAGNLATVIIAVCTVGGLVLWAIRKYVDDHMSTIHDTQARVLHQVQNSHPTNLRDDIDGLSRGIGALREDLQAHLSWHQVEHQRGDAHDKDGL